LKDIADKDIGINKKKKKEKKQFFEPLNPEPTNSTFQFKPAQFRERQSDSLGSQ
jgi:hypothetical protein